MNSIVSAAAVATATAIPSLDRAVASTVEGCRPSAALARAEQVIAALRSSYVSANWRIEEDRAEQVLAYMRSYANAKDENVEQEQVAIEFFGSHGQSLDWIFRGDARGMICTLAAHSSQAGLVADGDLLDLVNQHALATKEEERLAEIWQELDDRRCETGRNPRGYKAAAARMDRQGSVRAKLEEQIVRTSALTIDGIIAKARALSLNLVDGESVEEGDDVELGVSITHDLLALGGVENEVKTRCGVAADPIFTAIETHRAARQAYEQACEAHSRVEETHIDESDPYAGIQIGSAEEDRIIAAWQETELGKLDLAMSKAFDIEDACTRELVFTTPTTAQGLAALLGYSRRLGGFKGVTRAAEWADALEWTVECAACSLAGQPNPPMPKHVKKLLDFKEQDAASAV